MITKRFVYLNIMIVWILDVIQMIIQQIFYYGSTICEQTNESEYRFIMLIFRYKQKIILFQY